MHDASDRDRNGGSGVDRALDEVRGTAEATAGRPPSVRGCRSFALVACLVAWTGDLLFVAGRGSMADLGLNLALFAGVLLLVVLAWRLLAARRVGLRWGRRGTLVLSGAALSVAALAVDPGWIAAALFTACVWALARGLAGQWPDRTVAWFEDALAIPSDLLTRALADQGLAMRWRRRHPTLSRARWLGTLLAWVVPLAIAAVFVTLLDAANPIIARVIGDAGEWLGTRWRWTTAEVGVGRVALWLAAAALAWTLLRVRSRRARGGAIASEIGARVNLPHAKRAFLVRTLVLCNLVFAVQSGLDLVYLTGGKSLPDGMTFAEYAHRGSYPLIAAAILAGLFALVTFRPGGEGERSTLARGLVMLWIGQSVLLAITAAWRLWLYVEQYSLSRWRLATVVWLAIVAVGLAILIERIRRRAGHEWLVARVLVASTAILSLCAVANLDGFIARYNVAHCAEVGGSAAPIDLAYLESLGEPALPAMRTLASASADPDVASEASIRAEALRAALLHRLSDWRSWSIRRSTILREDAGR